MAESRICGAGLSWVPIMGFLPFPRGTSPHSPAVPDIRPLSGELCIHHVHCLRAGPPKGDGASVLIPEAGFAPGLWKAPQMEVLMFPSTGVDSEFVGRWQPHLLGLLKLNLIFFLLRSTSDGHTPLGALWAWLRGLMCPGWGRLGWGGCVGQGPSDHQPLCSVSAESQAAWLADNQGPSQLAPRAGWAFAVLPVQREEFGLWELT